MYFQSNLLRNLSLGQLATNASAVIALVVDRNQHLWTNLALDALWICLTGAFYTLYGQALQTSLACDLRTA
jgi:hypothetical protein